MEETSVRYVFRVGDWGSEDPNQRCLICIAQALNTYISNPVS